VKVKLLTITSAAFPFVGALPSKSHRFRRVFSSPELGTSGPEYVHGFARRELRKLTESGRRVKECVEGEAAAGERFGVSGRLPWLHRPGAGVRHLAVSPLRELDVDLAMVEGRHPAADIFLSLDSA
jgi:hypothetical protein